MQYKTIDIGLEMRLKDSVGALLAEDGSVVVSSRDSTIEKRLAQYLWSDGKSWPLGHFIPKGINADRTIVGNRIRLKQMRYKAVVANKHGTQNLFAENFLCMASGVNSKEEVTGFMDVRDLTTGQLVRRQGFISRNGVRETLPVESPAHYAMPEAINDQGWVIGTTGQLEADLPQYALRRTVLWKQGERRTLPIPNGFDLVEPIALNNQGQVLCAAILALELYAEVFRAFEAGEKPRRDIPYQRKTFIYNGVTSESGALLDLQGRDINDQGDILGVVSVPAEEREARGWIRSVLYKDTTLLDLRDLLPDLKASPSVHFTALNNSGMLVGSFQQGDQRKAFLALPQ